MGDISLSSIYKYADRHKFDVKIFDDIATDRAVPWNKIVILQKIFSLDYDYVVWIDADALFIHYDKDIRDEIEQGKELYMVKHFIGGKDVPNTGVMLLKNSSWSEDFLNKTWEMKKYTNHKWWENAAVMELLGYQNLLDGGDNTFNHSLLEKIKWLDLKWNNLPGVCETDDPIINHYAGRPLDVRIKYMKRDASGIYSRFKLKPLVTWNAGYKVDVHRIVVSSQGQRRVQVQVTNKSSEPWGNFGRPDGTLAINLSYHILNKNGEIILFDGTRSSLPDIIWPEESLSIPLTIVAPQSSGHYTVRIGLVQEGVGWFDDHNVMPADVDMVVEEQTPVSENRYEYFSKK